MTVDVWNYVDDFYRILLCTFLAEIVFDKVCTENEVNVNKFKQLELP